MKSSRVGIILSLCLVFSSVLAYQLFRSKSDPIHVFVNETSDHRFDESIQVSILAAFNRTHVQNAVVITDRFPAVDFLKSASGLFEKLQLVRKTNGRAILYLYSPKEHALKIEVGYALEGVLPDVLVHGLELAAKSFIFVDRFQDFWAELINTLNIEIYEKEDGKKMIEAGFDLSTFRFVSGGAGVLSSKYAATPEQLREEMKPLAPTGAGDFSPNSDPALTLDVYLKSLRLGIGDPKLQLLTPESRIFREFTPLTNFQLYRNWKMITAAGLSELICESTLCIAFWKDGHPVLPVILHKVDGLWYVDEPMSWSLFHRYEDSMRVFLKFPLSSKSHRLQNYISSHMGRPLYAAPPVEIESVANQRIAGELPYLFFNLFWLERVEALLSRDRVLQSNEDRLWIALDVYTNLGRFSKVLEILRALVKIRPTDVNIKNQLKFYSESFKFDSALWKRSL